MPGSSAWGACITGRIPGLVPGRESALTWAGEPLKKRLRPPEPKGKLDAMTGYSFTTPVWDGGAWVTPVVAEVVAAPRANGPEDQPREAAWDEIEWREREEQVRRLRQRIFKAAQEQDWPRVRNLQKLMLRSRSNTLVSVRQVTQRNAGRRTPGIDGEVALTSGQGRGGGAGAPSARP